MNETRLVTEQEMRRQIDRLACGELADAERQSLLAWLGEDVRRWRDCAMAFLEAQVWQETLGTAISPKLTGDRGRETADSGFRIDSAAPVVVQRTPTIQRSAIRRWLVPLAAVAACLTAFACGVRLGRMTFVPATADDSIVKAASPDKGAPHSDDGELLLASVPVTGGPLGNVSAVLQLPVTPTGAAKGPAASAVSERLRRQWERRGYELKEERRYLPAKLPDGRPVMVPVDDIKMKFVGRPAS